MKIMQLLQFDKKDRLINNAIIRNDVKPIFLNVKNGRCFVCNLKLIRAIKDNVSPHHISYYPQVIVWVHGECHKKIHDPENPLLKYIKYVEGDSVLFYGRFGKK